MLLNNNHTKHPLKFIGRGSAFNIEEGNTSAFIKNNNSMLLLDCGETTFSKIKELNLLEGVKNLYIFITHLHPDHVGSLGTLLFYCKYVLNIKPIVVHPTPDIDELIALYGATDTCYVDNFYGDGIESLGIKEIMCNNMDHVDEILSYSYTFTFDDGTYFYYTGDTFNPVFKDTLSDDKCIAIYTDTCLADYEGNVHLSLNKLEQMVEPEYRHKIFCMHLDSSELDARARELGFNVVENISKEV